VSTFLFVLLFIVLGVGVVLVAMRSGSRGPVLDPNRKGARRLVMVGTALTVVIFLLAIPIAVAIDNSDIDEKAGPVKLTAQEREGRQIFNRSCVQCHALGASGAVQLVGPDLDELRPPKELVLDAIEKGRAGGQGQMPAQLVTGPDAEAVAAYVAKVAGRDEQP
jgi:mono/diheme cytochrome c family protein